MSRDAQAGRAHPLTPAQTGAFPQNEKRGSSSSETSLGHVKSERAAPHVTTGACEKGGEVTVGTVWTQKPGPYKRAEVTVRTVWIQKPGLVKGTGEGASG